MTTYDFKTQLADGQKAEAFLDRFFSRDYFITPATRSEQRQGIDRWFTKRTNGARFAVEYKSDKVASRTGNAFVETTSVDTASKAGWAFTSRASVLVYYLPLDELVYILALSKLREVLPVWIARYPRRPAKNKEYNTWGLCVPLREFERHAEVINLSEINHTKGGVTSVNVSQTRTEGGPKSRVYPQGQGGPAKGIPGGQEAVSGLARPADGRD